MKTKYKGPVTLIALALAAVLLCGMFTFLVPSASGEEQDPQSCLHAPALLLSTDPVPDTDITVNTYYCSACETRFEKQVSLDALAQHMPMLNDAKTDFLWSGNWTFADWYREEYNTFNTVHNDTNDSSLKWIIYTPPGKDYSDGFWQRSSGYRVIDGILGPGTNAAGDATQPRHDFTMTWTAFDAGNVRISATDFTIGTVFSDTKYSVTVYKNNELLTIDGLENIMITPGQVDNDEKWNAIFADMTIAVEKGDRISFRCHREGGANNEMFYPAIQYTGDILYL